MDNGKLLFFLHTNTMHYPFKKSKLRKYLKNLHKSTLHFHLHSLMAKSMLMLLLFLFMAMSTAVILQNPDFESPPTNITSNNSNPLLLQNGINKIPGWSFSGMVWYVTDGPNISLPGNGHGVQLGQDGKINQTFKVDDNDYVNMLTFTLAPESKECSNNTVAVNVSTSARSKVFTLERHYGNEMWESHAFYFESWDDGNGFINLVIQGVSLQTEMNIICRPVVDTFIIKKIGSSIVYGGNMLVNGGLEVGPAFLKNSEEGVLLDEEPDQSESPLQQWSIIGTVKYIDSENYYVPEGNAAIEIVSNEPSGIITILKLSKGTDYSLEFTMGDAGDSCIGDLILQAQVGKTNQNFTLQSNGTGSAQNQSLSFKADANLSFISFTSLNQGQRSDGVLCGPVIDNIILSYISSPTDSTPKLSSDFLSVLFIVLVMLIM
ncbi:protein DUF642 L-GALACTONO-1,4-LACTONE-RESPONSIVE GENE 2-like [Mercurialis annua]|uniref:protein DUF642 L-GALACTONO-1,4-LACTONE-RESPONSIVE GENE 2-like n=1 Tax=Mercurialis annua TaxID=3986 RepID=UPI002160B481|nr:protein DUF642 L-GALACTONO-1,4-LACTONE-RESPONSIVE GENE 2-like [Mercurialis annua]